MSSGISFDIDAYFQVEAEQHVLEAFQNARHFVPGLKDENGFRRDWQGDEVHILTLRFDGNSPLLAGQQILRVIADSPQEVSRMMRQAIKETFFAQWTAQQAASSSYEDWRLLNEKRNQFQHFINWAYKHEIETGRHAKLPTVFDVAVFYMRKERNRLANRIGRLLRREKAAAPASEWIPKEWRG